MMAAWQARNRVQPGRVGMAHLNPRPPRMTGLLHCPPRGEWWAMPTLQINDGGPCPLHKTMPTDAGSHAQPGSPFGCIIIGSSVA
jgi:hypothetical protein